MPSLSFFTFTRSSFNEAAGKSPRNRVVFEGGLSDDARASMRPRGSPRGIDPWYRMTEKDKELQ